MMSSVFHVGPFFKCITSKGAVSESYLGQSCPQGHDLELHNIYVDFCPKCGKKTTPKIKKESLPKVRIGEILEAFDEAFNDCDVMFEGRHNCSQSLEHYWFPNQRRDNKYLVSSLDSSNYDDIIIPTIEMIKTQKEWLANNYIKEYQLLSKHYDKVDLEWGIVGGYW